MENRCGFGSIAPFAYKRAQCRLPYAAVRFDPPAGHRDVLFARLSPPRLMRVDISADEIRVSGVLGLARYGLVEGNTCH